MSLGLVHRSDELLGLFEDFGIVLDEFREVTGRLEILDHFRVLLSDPKEGVADLALIVLKRRKTGVVEGLITPDAGIPVRGRLLLTSGAHLWPDKFGLLFLNIEAVHTGEIVLCLSPEPGDVVCGRIASTLATLPVFDVCLSDSLPGQEGGVGLSEVGRSNGFSAPARSAGSSKHLRNC